VRRRYEVEGTEQTDFPNCAERDARASDGWARVVRPDDPRPQGFIVYGPYADLPSGGYRVTFRLRAEPTSFPGGIGTVDVRARGDVLLASRELAPEDFRDGGWHDLTLSFQSESRPGIEFRLRTAKPRGWVLGADVITLEPEGDPMEVVRAFADR
jgi:hypothetical protein